MCIHCYQILLFPFHGADLGLEGHLGETLVPCFALGSPNNRVCKPDLCEEGSDMGLTSSAGKLSVIRMSLKEKWNFCGLKNFHLSNPFLKNMTLQIHCELVGSNEE